MAAVLFSASPVCSSAQVISGWDESVVLPGSANNGIISDIDDHAGQEQFIDWNTTLADFGSVEMVTQEQLEAQMKDEARISRSDHDVFLNGRRLNIPSYVNEDGIDLYMLSDEGIAIYMAILAPVYYQDTDADVIRWVRFYGWNNRKRTAAIFRRYDKWEAFVRQTLRKGGLPEELAEICLVESGCTSDALSPAGARGMWQIMPATGRHYGMVVQGMLDERLDPVKSTGVAVRILADNYARTGDWTFAVASYNCGSGRFLPAKVGRGDWQGVKDTLPKETQQYVPSLLALHYLWMYRDRLGF